MEQHVREKELLTLVRRPISFPKEDTAEERKERRRTFELIQSHVRDSQLIIPFSFPLPFSQITRTLSETTEPRSARSVESRPISVVSLASIIAHDVADKRSYVAAVATTRDRQVSGFARRRREDLICSTRRSVSSTCFRSRGGSLA